ncbi:arsenate reductase/protein-tyrosine-phosphatase family protein [Actinomarinicola tropica]|uniref:Helix-turn-helix domain-containing protein n=1 Tax=Actinomarinicola tropica TaxID=2789776 RepID=A0A5Q2RF29_9ACTN|nr:helix-turn-helix domain-containing protein [Actinomarinicola tropica]QGG94234.1 helix-turn-helix domain-containing protein [Actinomarinicola tropica]
MDGPPDLEHRARRHAALGDPVRLRIVDELATSDRAPVELRQRLGIESNLLAHHLEVLESVGVVERHRSSGDGRRRYVHLVRRSLDDLVLRPSLAPGPALFVCTANSARSQLAAALWRARTGHDASSAGTHPAERVHPGAVHAARRAGLDLGDAVPQALEAAGAAPALVVTVCDRAHEELSPSGEWLHWSVPDPVPDGSAKAFDAAVAELRTRIDGLVGVS